VVGAGGVVGVVGGVVGGTVVGFVSSDIFLPFAVMLFSLPTFQQTNFFLLACRIIY
jgi:hypothetical protein